MGLVVFGAMALYLVVSIAAVSFAAIAAKRNGNSAWRWGGAAALVMYLLVFWDHIPTVLVHNYYCEKEAGIWVYKTVEQWKAENPGVMETLVANKGDPSSRQGDMVNYIDTYFVNQRFLLIVKRNGKFFINRWRHEREVVDATSYEVLARYVDFSTSYERPQAGWSGWKIWLENENCVEGRERLIEFGKFFLQFKGRQQ